MGNKLVEDILAAYASDLLHLSPDQHYALKNMQTCRTAYKGGKVLVCPKCDIKVINFNPCNQRGCPICYQKRQISWEHALQKRLAPISHYHLTFSIPAALTATWLQDKQAVITSLFSSVSTILTQLGEKQGLLLGYVLFFQSHGRGLSYKPHLHCILTAGGLDANHQWIPLENIPYSQLKDDFHQLFIQALTRTISSLAFIPPTKELRDHEWKVFATFHQNTGNRIATYLSHSIAGVVIDMKHGYSEFSESGQVSIHETHDGKPIDTILTKQVFMERYLNHIPPKGAVTVRYYGLYSNRHRGDLQLVQHLFVGQNEQEPEAPPEYEYCPKCHAVMRIEFLFAPMTEAALAKKLNLCQGPPAHGQLLATA